MSKFLAIFLMIPLAAFVISLLLPRRSEKMIAGLAQLTAGLHAIAVLAFTICWFINGHQTLDIKQLIVYRSNEFEFFFDFYFDKVTAVFALTGSVLAFFVCTFSKFYMHRELGFKRYFSTLLLFIFGYHLIVFSGNLETLFTGWEIIGLCSFLLISFYRDRYLPVRNALKIISVFRLSDILLIAAMWMCHHLWHANITFHQLHTIAAPLAGEGMYLAIIICIVLAAIVKSAQFPFTFWLPRAMEGPTSSSAIFYGSLSVHIGVFLLLRTAPMWHHVEWMQFAIASFGILTAIIATGIAKVQSTVKTQIAYASAAQIGIIFVEVAFGLEWLALFHFGANAFFRTYQLLVSPSVMNYKIHDQFFTHEERPAKPTNKLRNTIYVMSIKEWSTDSFFRKIVWFPFKLVGGLFRSESPLPFVILTLITIAAGLLPRFHSEIYPESVSEVLAEVLAGISVLYVLAAFASRGDALRAWGLSSAGFLLLFLAFMENPSSTHHDFLVYFVGIIPSIAIGGVCLWIVKAIDGDISLSRYHGYAHKKPITAIVFLLAGIGLVGFPITTAFVGLDVLLSGIEHNRIVMLVFTIIVIAFAEITALRIYARVFLGNYKQQEHPVAFKAS